MKKFTFSVNGQKLVGTLFFPKKRKTKNPAALIIHGWMSKQDRGYMLAKTLNKRGYICMTFDLRGHGKSAGKIENISRKDSFDDVTAAYDFLAKIHGVDSRRVMIIGSSFGGYMATLLSAKKEVSSLILRVPSNYRDAGFNKPQFGARRHSSHTEWKEKMHSYQETKALRATHNFKGRILIVESEKDELVPSAVIKSYVKAVKKKNVTHVVMRGAPHSLSKDKPRQKQFANIVLKWLT